MSVATSEPHVLNSILFFFALAKTYFGSHIIELTNKLSIVDNCEPPTNDPHTAEPEANKTYHTSDQGGLAERLGVEMA